MMSAFSFFLVAICSFITPSPTQAACNGTLDCKGTCGGDYENNICGYCINTNLLNFDTYGQDCSGICGGTKRIDKCQQCVEESDPQLNSCVDCRLIPNGPHKYNQCGFCLNTDIYKGNEFTDYGKDCRGICDGGFTNDKCGNCLATSDINRDSCLGCDKVLNSGKEFNQCGRCVAAADPNFNDYGRDCRGICASSVADAYYVDDCGQCLLPNDDTWNACLSVYNQPTGVWSTTSMPTSKHTYNPTYLPTRYVEKGAVTVTKRVSMVMISLIIIAVLILLLCVCGGYILYAKYKKTRNIHLDYVQNINVGGQDYEERTEGDIVIADNKL